MSLSIVQFAKNRELSYARRMEPSSFLLLPKVELHEHLDGSLRPQTILDLAHAQGVRLPVQTVDELVPLLSPGPSSLETYLKAFQITTSVMQSPAALIRVAQEQVEDWYHDGVVYGEIRFAPEQHLLQGLKLQEVVEAVLKGLDEGKRQYGVETGLILCSMRHATPRVDIARLVDEYQGSGVVGFDLAGEEAPFRPALFQKAFDYCAEHFLAVTCHAGEVTSADYIREALVSCRALRIGHGTQLMEDFKNADPLCPGPLARWIIDRGILLEVCPSSNVQTKAVTSLHDHPAPRFLTAGIRMALCTDNRLVSATSLTREWELASQSWGWDLELGKRLQRQAMEASFASKFVKDAIVTKHFQELADKKGV